MPMYSFKCKCGHRTTKLCDVHEAAPRCECGREMQRVIKPAALKFRGPGFYATDYGPRHEAKDVGTGKTKKSKVKEAQKDAAS